jgi:hypothetical protein
VPIGEGILETVWRDGARRGGILKVFDEISFRETGYETIFVFPETAEISKETSFAKHEIAKTKKTLSKNKKFNCFSFNSCEDAR